jgi:GPH family glycoside/pentoside/hexuronide:cation symporter
MTESKESYKTTHRSTKRMMLWGLGGVYGSIMWAASSKLQLYATHALGLSFTFVLIFVAVYTIIDAINDPIMGYLMDKSSRFTAKHGKRYPYIMIGGISSTILLILLFIPVSADPITTLIWMICVICIWETLATIREVGNQSLRPDLFRDQNDRVKLGQIGAFLGVIGAVLGVILIPILISAFGGQYNASAYTLMAIVVSVICLIIFIPYSFATREPADMREFRAMLDKKTIDRSHPKEVIFRSFKDKNWMGLMIGFLASTINFCILIVGVDYYICDYLELDIALASIPSLALILTSLITIPLWVKVAKKFGVRTAYFASMMLSALSSFLFIFAISFELAIALAAIAGIGLGGSSVVLNAVVSQAIDNATLKSGLREEGTYNGIMLVFQATGKLFQAIIFTISFLIFGYVAGSMQQTEATKFGLLFTISIIPGIITLIGALFFWKLNTITKEVAAANQVKLIELGL